jgi:FkbH-like protein
LPPAAVRALVADPDALVLTVSTDDRFGDNGLVGAVLARRAGGLLRIENFLLSCRVFARGIESACLAWLLRHAREAGVEAVLADYRPTTRNHRVADFYPRHGFTPSESTVEDGAVAFRHGLTDIVPPPEHVRLVVAGVEP